MNCSLNTQINKYATINDINYFISKKLCSVKYPENYKIFSHVPGACRSYAFQHIKDHTMRGRLMLTDRAKMLCAARTRSSWSSAHYTVVGHFSLYSPRPALRRRLTPARRRDPTPVSGRSVAPGGDVTEWPECGPNRYGSAPTTQLT